MLCTKSRALPLAVLVTTLSLLAASPAAFAQATQFLQVDFVTFNVPAAPLSDWLTAGIALLLAASAIFVLRRQTGRAGRFSGWMLAVVAGAMLFSVSGQDTMSDAHAVLPAPAISLVSSPGTVDVIEYQPASPLNVTVTNNSGAMARITAITIESEAPAGKAPGGAKALITGFYFIDPASTCVVGTVLSPGNSCTIVLEGLS